MEHTLEFLNPEWHHGENVTVRLGDKWIKKAFTGQKVVIVKTGEIKPVAEGIITEIRSCFFGSISIGELLKEHDPECRTPRGLAYAMLLAYPEFSLNSLVTVITFKI